MAKKITISGSNLLSSLSDAWGGSNSGSSPITVHGTRIPAGAEWGMNRGEVERFIKAQLAILGTKIGCPYIPNAKQGDGFYHLWGFADSSSRDLYLSDSTTYASLLLCDISIPISMELTFVGTYNSLAELQAVQNPTNNDYGFVIETDAQGNEYYDRYKYVASSQQWLFEYKVEITPFTDDQWAAIQSGITSALVTKLNALPDTAIQSVTVGETTTGAAGSNASVTNSGTATAPVLNFTIPQGAKGDTGDTGATGPAGATGTTFTPSVDSSGNLSWTNDGGKTNPATVNIKGAKGDKGDTGAQGPAGDTVIIGGESTYTLYGDTGQNTNGAMTQKAVTDKLTELAGELTLMAADLLTDVDKTLSNGTIVRTNTPNTWYINNNYYGYWYHISNYRGKTLEIITGNITGNYLFAFTTVIESSNKNVVDYALDSAAIIINENTKQNAVIPSDANYLFVQTYANGEDRTPQSLKVYGSIKDKLEDIAGEVDENTADIEAMKTKSTQGDTLLAPITTGVILDARTSKSTFGSEITSSTTTYGTTGYIDVTGHTELHIYGTLKSTSNTYANITGGVFYDANQAPIEEGVFVIGHASTALNGWIVRTVPENAAYFRLTQGHSGVGSNYYFVDIRNWQDETTHIKEIAVGAKTASGTSYNSNVSGLTATNVQDAIDEINGSIQLINNYETDSFTGTSNITVSKVTEDNGWLITNVTSTTDNYALYSLPSLTVGETYVVEFDYVANLKSSWWWGEVGSNTATLLSHGITIPASGAGHMKANLIIDNGARYLRLASKSQNSGNTIKICNLKFYQPKSINERVTALENGSGGGGGNDMESLVRQAVYGKDVSLLHFSDIHADTAAATAIKKFYEKYSSSIDDMASTGDVVYYYWNDSGGGYEWWQSNGIPEALFVIGNHDGADESTSSDTWKEGSANWDYKGKAWDYDTYFANYITARGIDMPTGYDDSTSARYKCLYWKKDYPASATGHSGVRVIGLDCMHYNDGFRFTSNDQEDWLAATLAETLDSTNAAYGYHVVIMCHYPLDGFNGSNETWNDSTHKWVYNQNANGGIVMDNGKRVNFHLAATSSMTQEVRFSLWRKTGKDTKNTGTDGGIRIGNIISSWINSGGRFVAWICGHHHVNYMFYPQQFPNILNITIAQAGNARGNAEGNRNTGYDSHTCANLYAVNTASSLLKIVRVGFTQKANLVSTRYLCINYETGEVISEG